MTLLKFKHGKDEPDLVLVPKELREAMFDFAVWSARNGMPTPIITCIGRTEVENKAVGGAKNSLHLMTEADPAGRACDLRDSNYSDGELARAVKWWQQRIMTSEVQWEFMSGRHGTGPHFHLGIKRP